MSVVQKYNIHTGKEKNVSSYYFTGKVIIREILGEENSSEQEMYHVIFYNGALTSLHYHESDQILIATKGKGVVGLVEGRQHVKVCGRHQQYHISKRRRYGTFQLIAYIFMVL